MNRNWTKVLYIEQKQQLKAIIQEVSLHITLCVCTMYSTSQKFGCDFGHFLNDFKIEIFRIKILSFKCWFLPLQQLQHYKT